MNIDDIVDKKTNTTSLDEKFRQEWLDGLPPNQWPSYIDESAQLVVDGILIGKTDLTKTDFPMRLGNCLRNRWCRW